MSYILDALRRADQERQRSVVPTVHTTQQMPTPGEHDIDSPSNPWAWGLALGALVLGTLALWAWWNEPSRSLEPPPPTAVRGPARSENLPPAEVRPAPAAPSLPPATLQAQAAAPVTTAPAAPASLAQAVPPPPTSAPPARAAASSPRLVKAAPPQLRLDTAPVASLPQPTPLPPGLKAEWSLSVDGAIYSDRPADRLLIVGGQLLREGESLREGVVVETIQPKAAVLRHKGQRYTVSF